MASKIKPIAKPPSLQPIIFIMTKENKKRQRCEVYSRVCGYLRPVTNWNDGKQAEFKDRVSFNTKKFLK